MGDRNAGECKGKKVKPLPGQELRIRRCDREKPQRFISEMEVEITRTYAALVEGKSAGSPRDK